MRPVVVIPSYNAGRTVGGVIAELQRAWADASGTPALREMANLEIGGCLPILVVDDGSSDDTMSVLSGAAVTMIRHDTNRGKGAALRSGMRAALEMGFDTAITIDADGQHSAADAIEVLLAEAAAADTIVLGVRDLSAAGAPLPNRIGNCVSNFSLSILTLHRFHDTQCGLRRYPIRATLALRTSDDRFGFESEVILRAARAGMSIREIRIRCTYAPQGRQSTHYRSASDTVAIIARLHIAYLFPWIRAHETATAVVPAPRASVPPKERARRIGSYWAAVVVVVLVLLALRAALSLAKCLLGAF